MRFLFGPLTRRRDCRVPTWRGVVLLLLVVAGAAAGLGRHLLGALAPTDRVDGGVVVAEGWLPDYALAEARDEFVRGGYRQIFTTGGPVPRGAPLQEYGTHAEVAAAVLRRIGLPHDAVVAVPAPSAARDRTYASAVALREWLAAAGVRPGAVLVFTLGAHARRTRLLYQKAFGDAVRIGIVAVPSRDFDPARWWATSEGVRVVLSEAISYLYARLAADPD
ncbi:MAG TPA: ElyC/SanA/YdcF family protein [Rhodocyclaceae bacterium]|nr:ElyC/SanA/YdcF family protein [Rhodocyclaceae bacterium]HNH35600.1 ElyC/SanA/YdcF family protein [Rhodocyclaceae bacterium]